MKLNIGQSIIELRRAKGLTQEQLAGKVGVSAPAVSKWETGSSYPDIQLLPPLARALGCSMDRLMQFQPQLTAGQVGELEKKVETLFRQGGYKTGSEAVDMLLHEYPDEAYLKLRMGWQLQKWIPFEKGLDEEKANSMYDRVTQLYEQAMEGNTPYTNSIRVALANLYIANGKLEQAEELIKQLPEDDQNRQTTYATIYYHSGKLDKAEQEQQKMLYASINAAKNALMWLTNIVSNVDNDQKKEVMIDAQLMLVEYFGIVDFVSRANKLELLVKQNRVDEAEAVLSDMVDRLVVTNYDYSENMFFDKVEMKFNNTPDEMRSMMLALLRQVEGMDNPAFSPHMERLREHTSNPL